MSAVVEKRKYVRITLIKPLLIKFKIEAKSNKGKRSLLYENYAKVKNLSAGGMFIETPIIKTEHLDRVIDEGDTLLIEVSLPGIVKVVTLKTTVVRIEEDYKAGPPIYRVGISFAGISEEDREQLIHYMMDTCLD